MGNFCDLRKVTSYVRTGIRTKICLIPTPELLILQLLKKAGSEHGSMRAGTVVAGKQAEKV